jgi:hypothetical protein
MQDEVGVYSRSVKRRMMSSTELITSQRRNGMSRRVTPLYSEWARLFVFTRIELRLESRPNLKPWASHVPEATLGIGH